MADLDTDPGEAHYDNDPRVRLEPTCALWWLVSLSNGIDIAVREGDDGVYRAFEAVVGQHGGANFGGLLPQVPPGDFDSVVYELIGDPMTAKQLRARDARYVDDY